MTDKWLNGLRDESRRARAGAAAVAAAVALVAAAALADEPLAEWRLSCGCVVVVGAVTGDVVETLEYGPRCGCSQPCPRCAATGRAVECSVCLECGHLL